MTSEGKIMKTMHCAFLLAVVLIMLPVASYGQEQSPNKTNQDSGAEAKKDASSVSGLINNVFQEQKDKYQKEIQDQIQNKLKYVEDKFNAVKTITGNAAPEKSPQKDIAPATGGAAREPVEKKAVQEPGQPSSAPTDLKGKLNALYDATMAFLKQVVAILFI
ncbi:MAG: hypothetical protein M0P73_17275 [Syntrophobacterales bacterium]|nr:hypothetical protein [Syntrophobacterales bacterium]